MFNVAIIGLGNIALLFDTNKKSKQVLSHIKAIFSHQSFNLKYAFDTNLSNQNIVLDFFPNALISNDYTFLQTTNDIDIVVVATPTNTHFQIIKTLELNSSIKIFLMEKPLFSLDEEYEQISQMTKNKIVVNYLRRFDKNIQNLKQQIKTKDLQNPQKIIINYCKGLKNNGSHLIDLVNFLFENPVLKNIKILNTSEGFDTNDLNYDIYGELVIQNKMLPIYFISHNHHLYNIIKLEIYFENMLINYTNSNCSIEYHPIIQDNNFPTYKVHKQKGETKNVDDLFLMINLYEHLNQVLKNQEKNLSTYNDEIANKNFIQLIKKG